MGGVDWFCSNRDRVGCREIVGGVERWRRDCLHHRFRYTRIDRCYQRAWTGIHGLDEDLFAISGAADRDIEVGYLRAFA